jgi:hypothetical protein
MLERRRSIDVLIVGVSPRCQAVDLADYLFKICLLKYAYVLDHHGITISEFEFQIWHEA